MKTKQLGVFFIVSIFFLLNCAGPSMKSTQAVDHSLSANTYVNSTYNCKLSVPNDAWKLKLLGNESDDAFNLVSIGEEKAYTDLYGMVAVSKHPQKSLEGFAQTGTYDPKIAKYTYIAGKPAFFASKQISNRGFLITSQIYKFVNKGRGYIFSFGYLSQWDQDEKLQEQIDYILNSFAFLDERGIIQDTSAGQNLKGENLLNVAMLEMIDLRDNRPTKTTNILTNELQDKLTKSGKVKFVERRKLNKIIEEQKFQRTGMVSDANAVKIGALLGAKYVINSSLGVLNETSVIYVQVTNAENGNIVTSASTRCRKCSDDILLEAITPLASKLVSSR
jgi:hypothetical protein